MMMNDFTNPSPAKRMPTGHTVPEDVELEFCMLMSLALDEMLDDAEGQRFQSYMHDYPALAEQWRDWQKLDETFQATPSALPPITFVDDLELRIVLHERRRRLLWGFGLGVVVLALWVGLMAGAVSLGAFVMFNQAEWLSQLVHFLAQSTASFSNWWTTSVGALNALLATDQARLFVVGYTLAAAAMLGGWVFFLRRSTRIDEAAAPIYSQSA